MERHKGGHLDGCNVFPVGNNGLLLLLSVSWPHSPVAVVFKAQQLLLSRTLLEHAGVHPRNKVSR